MAQATVEGMAKFRAHIAAIPLRVRAAMTEAIDQGADELVGMMKRLAPVAHVDGGELRDSIQKEWAKAGQAGAAGSDRSEQLGAKGEAQLAMVISAGSRIAYYARWIEHGTSQRSAQPFFFPAYRTLKKRINSRITRAMRKAMRAGK